MPIDLSSYGAVETALFVKMTCNYYRATANANATVQTFTFSQYSVPVTIAGNVYAPLGQLLGVTSTDSQLRASPQDLSITLSGIPNSSLAEIINSKIKGSSIQVWRAFFNATTKQLLPITGNPSGRFQGIVNNYSLQEDWSSDTTTNTILLTCASTVDILNNKLSGRRTNPLDMKNLYPTDTSFDRVPNLANSNFNFGAVIK